MGWRKNCRKILVKWRGGKAVGKGKIIFQVAQQKVH